MNATRPQSAHGSEKARRPIAWDPGYLGVHHVGPLRRDLHALSAAGWRRRAGLLAVAGFLAFLFNFFGVKLWIPGLHSYAGV